MDWLYKLSTKKHLYIIVIKTMADETGDRIREIEFMKILIYIETLYTNVSVLDRV